MMTPDEERELQQAKFDSVAFKQIAAYLAHCHVATAGTFLSLKSTSTGERIRLRKIVVECQGLLNGMKLPSFYESSMDHADEQVKKAVARADQFLKEH